MVKIVQVRVGASEEVTYRKGKRLLDVLGSGLALLVLSPLLAVVGVLVWKFSGRPVLFVQERPGLDAKPFKMYKFRTMIDERDEEGNLLPDEQRLTPIGR